MFRRTWLTCTAHGAAALLLSLVVTGCGDTDAPGGMSFVDSDDRDGDGVANSLDNCPDDPNPDQSNIDGDHFGDVCDRDTDNDNIPDDVDNCPTLHNTRQADLDLDGIGDACDNCAAVYNIDQLNHDTDPFGDLCDTDDDNDGQLDRADNCALTPNTDQTNIDGDGLGDACDLDRDGDGVFNTVDNCPEDPNPVQRNRDGDHEGDVCEFIPISPETWPRVDTSIATEPIARTVASRLLGVPFGWDSENPVNALAERAMVPLPRDDQELAFADWILGATDARAPENAWSRLVRGETDLVILPVEPDDDLRALAKELGVQLDVRPVAFDGLVVVVHTNNPLAALTRDQVQAIYAANICRWDDLGGTPESIHAMRRAPGSGVSEHFDTLMMGDQPMGHWPADHELKSHEEMVEAVAGRPLAIGYATWHELLWRYSRVAIRPVPLDGVWPTAAALADGSWPMTTTILVGVRSDASDSTITLRDFLLGPAGQALVQRSGYVPIGPTP